MQKIGSKLTRTTFWTTLMLVLVFFSLGIYLAYVNSAEDQEKTRIQEYITDLIKHSAFSSNLAFQDSAKVKSFCEKLYMVTAIRCLAIKHGEQRWIIPETFTSWDEAAQWPANRLIRSADRSIFVVDVALTDFSTNNAVLIRAAADGRLISNSVNKARLDITVIIVAFIVLVLFTGYVFDSYYIVPVRKLSHHTQLILSGQTNFLPEDDLPEEFYGLVKHLAELVDRIKQLEARNKHVTERFLQRIDELHLKHSARQKELDELTSLIHLSLSLNQAETTGQVLNRISQDIIEHSPFTLAILFENRDNHLKFRNSHIRGLSILNNKLATALMDYILPTTSHEYEIFVNEQEEISTSVHFQEQLYHLGITGPLALLPLGSYGLLIVGRAAGQEEIDFQLLERLTFFRRIYVSTLDRINVFNKLKRNIQIRTAELETTNELLTSHLHEKDNMIKLVSHDLNAPLRNITGLLDSIIRKYGTSLNKDVLNRLNRIQNNIEREMQTIGDILNAYRNLNEKTGFSLTDTASILSSVREDLQFELNSRHIYLSIEGHLPKIETNPLLLKHIFLNLIDNATKYFDKNKRQNRIRVYNYEDTENTVFVVEDNGIGIASENLNDIFSGKSGHRGQSGSGLGLALCHTLTEKLNGKIWVESQLGQGSKFFVSFRKTALKLSKTVA